jgi:hypothetical protein
VTQVFKIGDPATHHPKIGDASTRHRGRPDKYSRTSHAERRESAGSSLAHCDRQKEGYSFGILRLSLGCASAPSVSTGYVASKAAY